LERLVLTSPMIASKGVNHRGGVRAVVAALGAPRWPAPLRPAAAGRTSGLPPSTEMYSLPTRQVCPRRESCRGMFGSRRAGQIGLLQLFRHMSRAEHSRFPRTPLPPILIAASGADRVTDTSATVRFAARLGVAQLGVIEGARHEILKERDAFRAEFWATFDRFGRALPVEADLLEMTFGET
jgi:lysophospholipase